MDSATFDRLTRLVASATTRRTALTGFAAGLVRLLAPPAATAQPRATCRAVGQICVPERGLECCRGARCEEGRCHCPQGRRRCRGRCIGATRCCGDRCGGGAVCRRGRCRCRAGRKRCGTRCIPRAACCRDRECGAGSVCRQGRCRCRAGFKPCRGGCIRDAVCCGGCPPAQICVAGSCQALTCGRGGPCRVFITSALYQGDLREGGQGSGIAGADAKCQALADASPRTRGGTYKAWLSDSMPASGPAARFVHNPGPYVLVDDQGTIIASDWADLTDDNLRAPILVTELGQAPELPWNTWTYTLPDGTPGGSGLLHCQDWTLAAFGEPGDDGAPGDAASTDSQWTRWGNRRFCDFSLHLYCFEQG